MVDDSRRQFIKTSGLATAGIGAAGVEQTLSTGYKLLTGLAALASSGCATMQFNYKDDPSNLIFDDIRKHPNKIHPPDYGCLLGLQGLFERRPGDYNQRKDNDPKTTLSIYKDHIGHAPAILVNQSIYSDMINRINHDFVTGVHDEGTIPFTFYSLGNPIKRIGSLKKLLDNKDFIKETESAAKGIVNMGIPLFLTTMREMNIRPLKHQPWTGQKTKHAIAVWKQIWQIFEDQGANQYTTWVWEIAAPEVQRYNYPIMAYYPGDEYVDWVGISAYSRTRWDKTDKSFNRTIATTYPTLRKNIPNKPVILSEFGRTRGSHQHKWLEEAFKYMQSWQGIKAAIFWNSTNTIINDDHTLSKPSREVMNRIYQTDYFHSAADLPKVYHNNSPISPRN